MLPGISPEKRLAASAAQAQMPQLDSDDIGGVVTSASGPEAGVWVIAETDEFDTRYAKIVVTDDEGRYVVPDLPDPRMNSRSGSGGFRFVCVSV